MNKQSYSNIQSLLKAGDQQAAYELFNRFTSRLIALARSRLEQRANSKVDPDDVVQSVYRSFFLRQQDDQFELDGWDSIWALLAKITIRKCGREIQALRAAKRDYRRENLQQSVENSNRDREEIIDLIPTPSEAAVLNETLELLMEGLDEKKREMLSLRLQGYTVLEVSQKTGRTERAVYRLLSSVKSKLEGIESQIVG